MTKHSLTAYCDEQGIVIGRRFGLVYGKGETRDHEREAAIDFRGLIGTIAEALTR